MTLVCLFILIRLGTWQWQRLHWKTDLIANIETAAHSPPLTSLIEIQSALEKQQPLEYRRVSLAGEFIKPKINDGHPFYVLRSNGKTMDWHIYQPFAQSGLVVFVDSGAFPDQIQTQPPSPVFGKARVDGYVRTVNKPNRFMPKSKPLENKWYGVNTAPEILNWADATEMPVLMAVTIDQIKTPNAGGLPPKIPEIRNSHLDYMLTWYSFAVILLVIYFIIHWRQGRIIIRR